MLFSTRAVLCPTNAFRCTSCRGSLTGRGRLVALGRWSDEASVQFLCQHVNLAREFGVRLQLQFLGMEVVVGLGLLESGLTVLADHHEGRQENRLERYHQGQRRPGVFFPRPASTRQTRPRESRRSSSTRQTPLSGRPGAAENSRVATWPRPERPDGGPARPAVAGSE